MTTAILMYAMLRRMIRIKMTCGCWWIVIVAANAGGAWSPIGDVTTIMLWIEDGSRLNIIRSTFLASLPPYSYHLTIHLCFLKKWLGDEEL